MTNREFRKHLHQKRLEAIREEVLTEKTSATRRARNTSVII
jgi:hypothetical protein